MENNTENKPAVKPTTINLVVQSIAILTKLVSKLTEKSAAKDFIAVAEKSADLAVLLLTMACENCDFAEIAPARKARFETIIDEIVVSKGLLTPSLDAMLKRKVRNGYSEKKKLETIAKYEKYLAENK